MVLCFVGGDGDIIARGVPFDHGGRSWWWFDDCIVEVDIEEWHLAGGLALMGDNVVGSFLELKLRSDNLVDRLWVLNLGVIVWWIDCGG